MEEMTILDRLNEAKTRQRVVSITDKVEATFGPNPCTNLHLKHQDGELLHLPCDSKRCKDCGPRKQLTMELQLTGTMGELCYIQRIDTRQELDRILSRMVKASQRTNGDFKYQVTGDDQRQYILITNEPCHPEQRRTSLKDWLKRIIHSWLYTDSRIRRSRSIGRLSLVPLRKKIGKVGTSLWSRVSGRHDVPELSVPDTYEELQDMIDDNEILRMIDYGRQRQRERYQMERKLSHRGGVW